jgi:uncharacterized membrane protein
MARNLVRCLVYLGLALWCGQGRRSMAQTASAGVGAGIPEWHGLGHPRSVPAYSCASARETMEDPHAIALGVPGQKVYQFRSVDHPGATDSFIHDFNDGIAVGYFTYPGVSPTAFYFKGTSNHLLHIPHAISSAINGINAAGQMVGNYSDKTRGHGFLYDGKSIVTLDVPESGDTEATDINTTGVIVGDYVDVDYNQHGFRYKKGTFSAIDCPGALTTVAGAINSKGEIVGSCYYSGTTHGFLLSSGIYYAIDFPHADSTFAYGVNDAGSVAGSYNIGNTVHGFVYSAGAYTEVDVPGAAITELLHIENNGNVVGYAEDSLHEAHGVIGH